MREADDRHELDVVDLQELAVDRAHVEHERLDLIAGAAGEDDRIIGGDPGAEGRHDGADVERRGRGQRVQETLRAGDRAALAWRVEGVDGVDQRVRRGAAALRRRRTVGEIGRAYV